MNKTIKELTKWKEVVSQLSGTVSYVNMRDWIRDKWENRQYLNVSYPDRINRNFTFDNFSRHISETNNELLFENFIHNARLYRDGKLYKYKDGEFIEVDITDVGNRLLDKSIYPTISESDKDVIDNAIIDTINNEDVEEEYLELKYITDILMKNTKDNRKGVHKLRVKDDDTYSFNMELMEELITFILDNTDLLNKINNILNNTKIYLLENAVKNLQIDINNNIDRLIEELLRYQSYILNTDIRLDEQLVDCIDKYTYIYNKMLPYMETSGKFQKLLQKHEHIYTVIDAKKYYNESKIKYMQFIEEVVDKYSAELSNLIDEYDTIKANPSILHLELYNAKFKALKGDILIAFSQIEHLCGERIYNKMSTIVNMADSIISATDKAIKTNRKNLSNNDNDILYNLMVSYSTHIVNDPITILDSTTQIDYTFTDCDIKDVVKYYFEFRSIKHMIRDNTILMNTYDKINSIYINRLNMK